MAITPRSKGLGNIGSIVNRQRQAAPTRPAPKPMVKMPVPKPAPRPMASPLTGSRTTMAQRQAMPSPFRNNTKAPMAKMNPMTYGPNLAQQGLLPAPMPAPNMLEPEMMDMMERDQYGNPTGGGYSPSPQPFNLNPNPGSVFNQPGMIMDMVERDQYGNPIGMDNMGGGQQMMSMGQQGLGQMFGSPYMDPYGPAGQQPGNFGNPNPLKSDYDDLEGSAFNTNPSMSGSMFSGPGFRGY